MPLTAYSDESLAQLAHEVRAEQFRRRGRTHRCSECGRGFTARAGAKTCSTRCRVRALRARATTDRKVIHRMIGIGYEGLALDTLIDRLQQADIEVLVDARLNAISRKPGFSKRALGDALAAAGIRYVHDPRLGNPRDNRAGYSQTDSDEATAARDRYRGLLRNGAGVEGIRDLAELAADHSIAVLCFEADGRHCHREQVIEAVQDARRSVVV